jgi:hypothetical protein
MADASLGAGLGANGPAALNHFMQTLLGMVIGEAQLSDTRLDLVANALLPLIVCDGERYRMLGTEALASVAQGAGGGAARSERLGSALTRLTSDNGMTASLDRMNRMRFKKNMRAFVTEVRGFIQTK